MGVLVAVLQAVVLGPILPDPMAARFSWSGVALAWTSTPDFLTIHLVVTAASAATFIGLPLLLRSTARWNHLGDDAPHARRLADFEHWTLLFGLVTTTFTLAVVHLVALANFARPPRLDGTFALLLAAYVAFAATWTVQVVRRFRRRAPVTSVASA